MLEVHSTKKYLNMPCGHAQHFHRNEDGSVGNCAAVHGYDRSVEITFSGEVDEHGWVVAFGGLKEVKDFLEYYLDHVTLLPADDLRIKTMPPELYNSGGLLATLRILPYGVSMEMTAVFLWERITSYITHITEGRCYVSKLQVFEHERNTGFVTADRTVAMKTYNAAVGLGLDLSKLEKTPYFSEFISPQKRLSEINSL